MTPQQQKEQFSIAYVRAVAAAARVNIYKLEVDDDSIDIGFASKLVLGNARKPRLEAQLKCSTVVKELRGAYPFPLPLKNYNDLRGDDTVPRILIVCLVPPRPVDWLTQNADQMIMRKAAFWHRLTGLPATKNMSNVTVPVSVANLFDPAALLALLKVGTKT